MNDDFKEELKDAYEVIRLLKAALERIVAVYRPGWEDQHIVMLEIARSALEEARDH